MSRSLKVFIDLRLPSRSLRGIFEKYRAIAVYNGPEGSLGETSWKPPDDIQAISPHNMANSDDIMSGRLEFAKNQLQGQLVTGFLTTSSTYTETFCYATKAVQNVGQVDHLLHLQVSSIEECANTIQRKGSLVCTGTYNPVTYYPLSVMVH